MKNALKLGVIMLCIVFLTTALANSKQGPARSNAKNPVNQETPYRPGRQNDVLFVEDLAGSFGPGVSPDPLWDGVLTSIFGAGNFGWFGPTADEFADGPDYATMSGYDLVIWNTYDYWFTTTPALTLVDQTNVGDYLLDGGSVWLIGQDVIWSTVDPAWLLTYFHLQSYNEDYNSGALTVNLLGIDELDPWAFLATADYTSNPFYHDALTPDAEAHVVLEDTDFTEDVGIFYPGMDFMTAFWAIDGRSPDPSSEWDSMVNSMLNAFGVYGIEETPSQDHAGKLHLNIAPVPVVRTPVSISYSIPIAGNVAITIYDKVGRSVATLVDAHKTAGSYSVTWNANVANGVYFVRLTCGELSSVENLVVIK